MSEFWAWKDTNALVPLGECDSFEEADSRAPGNTHWIFDREELERLQRELNRELPELSEACAAFVDAYQFLDQAPAPLKHAVNKARRALAKAKGE